MKYVRLALWFAPIILLLWYDIANYANNANVHPPSIQQENTQQEKGECQWQSPSVVKVIFADEKHPSAAIGEQNSSNTGTGTLYQIYLLATIVGVFVALVGFTTL